ncbi:MAG: DeoR/GlpR transcriptional regulator [Verrucomicrobia bacterium]|nr:DeoR/GlpR transcriptional regulator [Verrucomicrobiota bacterium]
MVPARRRQDLLQFLQTRGQATIKELAGWLGVSEATVRRDLDQLAGQELLTRTYGGAITPDGASSGAWFQDRPHTPEGSIARAACRLREARRLIACHAGQRSLAEVAKTGARRRTESSGRGVAKG